MFSTEDFMIVLFNFDDLWYLTNRIYRKLLAHTLALWSNRYIPIIRYVLNRSFLMIKVARGVIITCWWLLLNHFCYYLFFCNPVEQSQ